MNPSLGERPIAGGLQPIRRPIAHGARWLDIRTAWRRRIPIRGRIALFGAGVVALTVLLFSVAVYYLVQGNLVDQQRTALMQRGDQVYQFLERGPRFGRALTPFAPIDLNNSSEVFVQIFSQEEASYGSTGKINGIDPQW